MRVAEIEGTTKAIRIPDERNLGWPDRRIPRRSRPRKKRSRCCSASSTTLTDSSTRADGYAPLRKLYFLSAGPRDVLVPAPLVEEARQVLEDTTGLGSYAP
jgi:hypothetical protein